MEDFTPKGGEAPGAQASTASSHLMKVLFAARLCRPDLLVGITRLASKVSCWQQCHDRALRRMFCYIYHHADMELFGVISPSEVDTCEIVMSPDADLNGDMETTKSTSGLWVELRSADGLRSWPLAWRSMRQGSTAFTTPEAETISMATGLKSEGLPMQDLFSAALGRTVHLRRGKHHRDLCCARRILSRSSASSQDGNDGKHLYRCSVRELRGERRLRPALPGLR